MKKDKQLIRFDWAMKKLLRNKANFDILEGFLSELLSEDIKIRQIISEESNKDDKEDKHNRVDILVENSMGELLIIEVQNSKEHDYFHRILYGTSKVLAEHMGEGKPYATLKKVISITIAYFDLGQGEDYVYHGINQFKGIHKGDVLNPSGKQKELYRVDEVYKIYPEYWLIKVEQFNDVIRDKLDEWIYFLKNGAIKDDFSAKGLPEAKRKLDALKLKGAEKAAYERFLKNLRDIASEQHTKMADIQFAIRDAREEGRKEAKEKAVAERDAKEKASVIRFHKMGTLAEDISSGLDIPIERVKAIIEAYETEN